MWPIRVRACTRGECTSVGGYTVYVYADVASVSVYLTVYFNKVRVMVHEFASVCSRVPDRARDMCSNLSWGRERVMRGTLEFVLAV